MAQNLTSVDWSTIPTPQDDGKASHLTGMNLPDLTLPTTDDRDLTLNSLKGLTILYIYPMTGPQSGILPQGWNEIPGARGCTPQSCSFRDHHQELKQAGASAVFGLSTQDSDYQKEAATRLHLPFPLLSDADLSLANALNLPRFEVDGKTLLKRITLILKDTKVVKTFYPVFPPDQDATNVLAWLKGNAT